jgi:hypothetical protein
LWKALIFHDERLLKESSDYLGTGSYFKLFPVIFTARLWESELSDKMLEKDRQKIRNQLRQVNITQIVTFLENLPRDMLLVIKMNTLVASICRHLGTPSLVHYQTMAGYAIRGIFKSPSPTIASHSDHVSLLSSYHELYTWNNWLRCECDLLLLRFSFWSARHCAWLFQWLAAAKAAWIRWKVAFFFGMIHHHNFRRYSSLWMPNNSHRYDDRLFPISMLLHHISVMQHT